MGWENIFHCEWMEFPRKVLEYHFPKSDSLIDICKTDFKKYANKIDILTGGFPCQPFSMAGKRKGTSDERYLWGEMLRAIQEIKPKFVIAENVFGITNIDGGLVFEQVCLDLENEGYEVQPFIIPAVSKNAPHRRDRVWFIAYRNVLRQSGNITRQKRQQCGKRGKAFCELDGDGWEGITTNTKSKRSQRVESGEQRETCKSEQGKFGGEYCKDAPTDPERIGGGEVLHNIQRKFSNGQVFDAINEQTDWSKFPTQSPICSGDDGLPSELDGITFSKWRAESIKGYGNAIVPQVAMELFKQLEKL
jgi:DNA (cytosine-5)-methyltransferase 1